MKEDVKNQKDAPLAVNLQRGVMPPELIDLIRFLASLWDTTDDMRYKAAGLPPEEIRDFLIGQWPVVQGTRNQLSLKRIGLQPYNVDNVAKAVKWMLGA